MSDIAATINNGATNIQNLLNGSTQAIVRPNLTSRPTVIDPNAKGWVFDIPTGETEDFESDTTDHYTENGSFLNDHIVNKPIRISLTGLIGELVYRAPNPNGFLGGLRAVSGRLAQLSALGGNYTPGFVQSAAGILGKAQATANLINQYAQQVQSIAAAVSSFYGPKKITSQKAAYNTLFALWSNKTIFTITTPWADHPAMVIASMGFRQDQDSNDYSTISISFKEFRFASTKLTTYKGAETQLAPTAVQASPTTAQGPAGSNSTTLFDLSQSNGGFKNALMAYGQ